MLSRNRICLCVLLCALAALAGCGGVSSNQPVPPPGGSFSNSSLNGSYVFSFSGYDTGFANGSFFAVTGVLSANGSGALTSGSIDIVDPSLGAAFLTSNALVRVPVSGNYNITADGRGSGALNFTVNGSSVQFGLDFVLSSGAHGLITRFDTSGSGSGSIDLQATGLTQSSLSGSWTFGLNGVDAGTVNPLSSVGSLTLDGNGNVTTGIEDLNDDGNASGLQSVALSGSVGAGTPGTARITTSVSGFTTTTLDLWPIDATHFKLIETDAQGYLAGDAFTSTGSTAFPAGPLVLTLSGEDTQQSSFAAGGLLTSDGASTISGGLEDVNDEGYVGQAPAVSGSFTANGPRTVLTFNGIYNGFFPNFSLGAGNYTFAAYPFSGGVLLLEIDNGAGSTFGISSGTFYVQSATSLTSSQGYGLNLSGANGNGEVDTIAQFTATGTTMTGLYDANNSGLLVSDAGLGTGTWSVASNGRGTASFPSLQTTGTSMIGSLNLTFYVVDSSTVVFLETDTNQLANGAFLLQNPDSASPAARPRVALMRPSIPISRTAAFHAQPAR